MKVSPVEQVELECTRCDNLMEIYDEYETKSNIDDCLDEEGVMVICWKVSDCKAVTFYVCPNCKVIGVLCNKCQTRCQFNGHMGIKRTGSQYQRNCQTREIKKLPANAKILDKSHPRYDLSDEGKYNFNVTDWYPDGPQGDMPHFWSCETCNANFKFSSY